MKGQRKSEPGDRIDDPETPHPLPSRVQDRSFTSAAGAQAFAAAFARLRAFLAARFAGQAPNPAYRGRPV